MVFHSSCFTWKALIFLPLEHFLLLVWTLFLFFLFLGQLVEISQFTKSPVMGICPIWQMALDTYCPSGFCKAYYRLVSTSLIAIWPSQTKKLLWSVKWKGTICSVACIFLARARLIWRGHAGNPEVSSSDCRQVNELIQLIGWEAAQTNSNWHRVGLSALRLCKCQTVDLPESVKQEGFLASTFVSAFFFFSETKHNAGGSLTQILQRNNDAVAANKEHRDFRHHHLDEKKNSFSDLEWWHPWSRLFCFIPQRISGLSPWENTSLWASSARRHLPYWPNRNRTLTVWLKMHVSHKSLI